MVRWYALLVALGAIAAPASSWANGSVARASSGALGLSHGYPTTRQADRAAIDACDGDCRIVQRYQNTCAAVAQGAHNGAGWAFDDNMRAAERLAIAECFSHGDDGCHIVLHECDE